MTYPILTDEPGALETADAVRRGAMSPLEAVDAAIARIEHDDAHINAVVVTDFESAGATVDRASALVPDLAELHADYLRLLNVAMARGRPSANGQAMSLEHYYDLLDRQARCEFAWAELFAEYDFVLAPPLPFLAYKHDATPIGERRITINGKDSAFADALAWAGIATYPNLPSTVVPVGGNDGLPCGMQVMGPRWGDLDCIAAAGAIGKLLHG